MINIKHKQNNNSNDKFIIQIDNIYTIFANNIEDFKSELFDRIEVEIDKFVLSKLDEIEEEKELVVEDDIEEWLRRI